MTEHLLAATIAGAVGSANVVRSVSEAEVLATVAESAWGLA